MSDPRRITIVELARRLGLSPGSVSKALNDRPDVSTDVKNRVRRAARKWGYVPNAAARSLTLGPRKTLGVFLLGRFHRGVADYFGFQLLEGLMDLVAEEEYDLVLLQEAAGRKAYRERIVERDLNGAIFWGLDPRDPLGEGLRDCPVPVVSIDSHIPGNPRGMVTIDNRTGIALAGEHLSGCGARSPAFLGFRGDGYVAVERRRGFEAWASRSGLRRPLRMMETILSRDGGREGARALLGDDDRPDALICATDLQALGALDAAREVGVRVPDELQITGFDDQSWSALVNPPLTTISQDPRALARAALRQLETQPPEGTICTIAPALVVRGTTRGAAA